MNTPSLVPGLHAYHHTDDAVPHHTRARQLLDTHPEVRTLIGRDPRTAIWAVFLVVLQTSMAWLVSDVPIWVALVTAWVVGAFVVQGLWVMIHEAGHAAIFRSVQANHLITWLSNLPMVVPSAETFNRYHDRHHAHRGVYEEDGDLADHWEARLVGNSTPRKALWLLFYWAFQAFRAVRLARHARIPPVDRWVVGNFVTTLAFDLVVWQVLGPHALLYLFASLVFGIGLHPLGARWIQEHFVVVEGQETFSYYGIANRITFNVGYHVEHHDMPSIPWSRLPALRAMAPELYEPLYAHRSWTRLLLQFLFDPKLSLYSRYARPRPE